MSLVLLNIDFCQIKAASIKFGRHVGDAFFVLSIFISLTIIPNLQGFENIDLTGFHRIKKISKKWEFSSKSGNFI